MRTYALTGTVAAGKSTVARLFEQWGATRIDADGIVRELQQPGQEVFDRIIAHFGPSITTPGGALDRGALRQRVLADPADRAVLEAIVHPAVEQHRRQLVAAAAARGDVIVVAEIPLLFEAADPTAYDGVIVVDAPAHTRRQRLIDIRGLTPDAADLLLASQWSPERKRAGATWVIDNDGSHELLAERARTVWREMTR